MTAAVQELPLQKRVADIARSVLMQYGVAGDVSAVMPSAEPDRWVVHLEKVCWSTPKRLTLWCSETTPSHAVRTALSRQLDVETA